MRLPALAAGSASRFCGSNLDLSMRRFGAYSLVLGVVTRLHPVRLHGRWSALAHKDGRDRSFREPDGDSRVATRAHRGSAKPSSRPARPSRRVRSQSERNRSRDDSALRDRHRHRLQRRTTDRQPPRKRMLQLVVDIEMVDQVTGKTLWQRKGLLAEGQYEERGSGRGPESRRSTE